jgi:hypothetical protein
LEEKHLNDVELHSHLTIVLAVVLLLQSITEVDLFHVIKVPVLVLLELFKVFQIQTILLDDHLSEFSAKFVKQNRSSFG